jgi:hypothetical protein
MTFGEALLFSFLLSGVRWVDGRLRCVFFLFFSGLGLWLLFGVLVVFDFGFGFDELVVEVLGERNLQLY